MAQGHANGQVQHRSARRIREVEPLNNNNRGNNNRRRGRSNRPNGNGGGQQLNRIDSRARGNAPQLLEKYRKLAHDAHLNGDRVQAEYYLQFADHYFRVSADTRLRQEEQRGRPQGERSAEGNEDYDDGNEFSVESDFPSFDQPSYPRQERDDRPRPARSPKDERNDDRPARPERSDTDEQQASSDQGNAGQLDVAGIPYEPVENPFVRDNRGTRGLRPRRDDRRPRRDEPQADRDEPAGLDPTSLPPAISAGRDEPAATSDDAEPKPRRGRPRRKPSADDAGETLESVN